MNRLFSVLVCGLLLLNTGDLFARGSSSSVSRSSSSSRPSSSFSSSSSRSSSSSIFSSKPAAPKPAPVTKISTPAPVPAPAPVVKPTAVAPSALTASMQKQDAMGTKTYSSQAQAQTAFNNKFTSEPVARPSYIPNDVVRGTVHYHVVYHSGCYGYYDPTGIWIALAATDAIRNAQNQELADQNQALAVQNQALAAQNQALAQGQPIVQNQPIVQPVAHHHGVGFYFMVILGAGVLIAIVFVLVKASL